jgi:hypothetical protein
LLDILLADIKRNIPSAGYMANLARKLNRVTTKEYFDELKELLMQLDITHKTERIYIGKKKLCRLSFFFL